MSNRFHSKYHRHNHHTSSNPDPRYPDSGHDPIASPDSPFLGDFVMLGTLSSTQFELTAPAGSFINPDGMGLNVEGGGPVALRVVGPTNILGPLSAQKLEFTTDVRRTFTEFQPVTATGEFLVITLQGEVGEGAFQRAIRLWDASVFMDE